MHMIKIAITGPECTGKSTLAKKLAKHFETIWIPEYAREYIENLSRPYHRDDLLKSASGQYNAIEDVENQSLPIVFADTEMTVLKVWSDHKYGQTPPQILEMLDKQHFDHYLLMNIDLPWVYDSQREHPHLRQHFFDIYKNELISRKWPFSVISGTEEARFQNALEVLNFA